MTDRATDGQSLVFAVDLGGTYLRLALIDNAGKIHEQLKQSTPKGDSADELVDVLAAAAENWSSGGGQIVAASVVVPGTVDTQNAVVVQAPNLPSLTNFP